MIRLIGFFSVIMLTSCMLTSCNTCKKPGCNREAIGWDHPDGVGCMREKVSGGYCSKNHCATHHPMLE